jgi:K+-sensing histidine kinase KdpD
VEINAVTLEAMDVTHDDLVMNGVSVQMKLAKDLPLVQGDRVQRGPCELERIFDAYFTTKAGGLGTGLSVCRAIIQAHGDDCRRPGGAAQGTILQFTLPAGTDSAS